MKLLQSISAVLLLSGAVGCSQHRIASVPSPAVGEGESTEPTGIVTGFTDIGGEILEVTTSDGTKIQPATLAHLIGTVYDSTRGAPLGDASVAILGTDFSAKTDGSGEFHLLVPLEGEYRLSLSHPWLDSVAYRAEETVWLKREAYSRITVAIPHVRTILTGLCPEAAGRPDFATVVGFVADGQEAEPAGAARVSASWQILERENRRLKQRNVEVVVQTDGSGFYAICGVPVGRAVRILASLDETASRTAHVVIPKSNQGDVLFAWDRVPGQAYARSDATEHPIHRLDLALSPSGLTHAAEPQGGVLSGVISDRTTGQAVGGATVGVNGGPSTVARADGSFDIVDVTWLDGPNAVAVGRIGYEPWAQEIWLNEADETLELNLSVSLLQLAFVLDPVEVRAGRGAEYLTDVGFYRRQQFNAAGYFMDPEEIEERLGRVNYVEEFLTGVMGVEVVDSEPGSLGSSLRFARGRFSIAGCRGPRVYVDGMLVESTTDPDAPGAGAIQNTTLSEVVRPEDVYAMEVYRTPSQIPAQYGGAQSACGVLLIWTRRGR